MIREAHRFPHHPHAPQEILRRSRRSTSGDQCTWFAKPRELIKLVGFVALCGWTVAFGAAVPNQLVVTGCVREAGNERPLTDGSIELRWPGHEDAFASVTAPIRGTPMSP